MPRLPPVSGDDVIALLAALGYEVVRQRGSHVRLRKVTFAGEHNITVPLHRVVAKGTLNDIMTGEHPYPEPRYAPFVRVTWQTSR